MKYYQLWMKSKGLQYVCAQLFYYKKGVINKILIIIKREMENVRAINYVSD